MAAREPLAKYLLGAVAVVTLALVANVVLRRCFREETPAPVPWSSESPSPKETVIANAASVTLRPGEKEKRFRQSLIDRCLPAIQKIAATEIVVESVQEASRANQLTQAEVLALDRKWRRSRGIHDPIVRPYLTNPCAEYLRTMQRANTGWAELFVMDCKGCIVAESGKTSDYWQGDEAKWSECYNNGEGKVYAGEIEFDESTQAYVVQISVPVLDETGETIGALTASVKAEQ